MARISPLEPCPGNEDVTALVLYNKGRTPVTTTDINYALTRKRPLDVPEMCVSAQFVDPTTEQADQKWLLGFDHPLDTTEFFEKKQWIYSAIDIAGASLGIRACKGPDPPKKNNDKKPANRGRNNNARRGKK
jgi:hypothetical protein